MKTFSSLSMPALAPRNPHARAARGRHAGAHGPGPGARRQQARRALQRDIAASLHPEPRPSP